VTLKVGYWDNNYLITGPCIARPTKTPTTMVIGASPWSGGVNAAAPGEFGRNPKVSVVISNIKQNVRNIVDLSISCPYTPLGGTYLRIIRIPIDGYVDNPPPPKMTFKGTALPTIPANAADATTKISKISWTFSPDDAAVGVCTARIMRVGDVNGWIYPPWGKDAYLKANDFYSAGILYPNTPGTTWTYNAELDCANVNPSPAKFTLKAMRLQSTEGNFEFKADELPEMAFDAPVNSGMVTNINWDLVGVPGVCTIKAIRVDGAWYTPGLHTPGKAWGEDAFIQAHKNGSDEVDGVDVAFQYPNTKGATYTYIFEMNCANDPNGPQQITLTAYRGTAPNNAFTFAATALPVIAADAAPNSTRPAVISWTTTGDVGICAISQTQADGTYTPNLTIWGTDTYIQNNLNQEVQFGYSDTPGETYSYVFEMNCTLVPGSQRVELHALRRSAGNGRVPNYGYGSVRF